MTKLEDVWDEIKWPRFVPVPKPGQNIEDDECGWVSFDKATISDIETFLAAEPDWTQKPEWRTPLTIRALTLMVYHAKQQKVGPDVKLLPLLGMIKEE